MLNRLYQWDVMRANKVPFAWGVEARVPFLDKAFLDLVMTIDPAEKMVRAPCMTSQDQLLSLHNEWCVSWCADCAALWSCR